jgi:hypothetical protein
VAKPELLECQGWTGRRVWLRRGIGEKPALGTIVHAFPTPFNRDVIDLAVRLSSGAFTVVSASQRGTDWDFAPDPKGSSEDDPPEPKAA